MGEGDGDVATPVWDLELERGGDVFIAVGGGFGERATRTSPPRIGNWNWNGVAMSSSSRGRAWAEGDEDVAAPVWDVGLKRGGDVLIAVGREGFEGG